MQNLTKILRRLHFFRTCKFLFLFCGLKPKPEVNSTKGLGGFVGTIEAYKMQKEKLQKCTRGRDIGVDVPRLAPPSAQTGSKFHEVTYG